MLFKALLTIGFSLFVIGTLVKSTHQNVNSVANPFSKYTCLIEILLILLFKFYFKLTKDNENQTNETTNGTVEELNFQLEGSQGPLDFLKSNESNNTFKNNSDNPEWPGRVENEQQNSTRNDSRPILTTTGYYLELLSHNEAFLLNLQRFCVFFTI